MLSSNTLFGTTSHGGTNNSGTLFKLNIDGHGFTTLYGGSDLVNGGGFAPEAPLFLSSNVLYGTSLFGGTGYNGNLYRLNTDGSDFTVLYSFSTGARGGVIPWYGGWLDNFVVNSDGAWPSALVLSGNTFYGTAYSGGDSGSGTVFAVKSDGTGFTNLYAFSALGPDPVIPLNNDGAWPNALVLSGNTLYGTAEFGGTNGGGAIFAINTDGRGFTDLYEFGGVGGGGDVSNPLALALSGNTLYGTTGRFGLNNGTVFRIQTDGTGFAVLHAFLLPSDGSNPNGFVVSGNIIYGTAGDGGSSGNNGTVFKLNTDGTGFTVLYNFNATSWQHPANSDGAIPNGGLVLSGNTLYGVTFNGGASDDGTVFSVSLPSTFPQLSISAAAGNVILTWPTNAAGFTLQSATDLTSSAVWAAVSPAPVLVNGLNTVTNPLTGTRQYYRLKQ
jgi:uncharacterized repeat protein (TIGR03803 family)